MWVDSLMAGCDIWTCTWLQWGCHFELLPSHLIFFLDEKDDISDSSSNGEDATLPSHNDRSNKSSNESDKEALSDSSLDTKDDKWV